MFIVAYFERQGDSYSLKLYITVYQIDVFGATIKMKTRRRK